MLHFAYGSNMCTGRLANRVPSATPVRVARLQHHSFRFHKRSDDGSGKGNALETGNPDDVTWGVVFKIDPREKSALDEAEGLGKGYVEKAAAVLDRDDCEHEVFLYVAEPGAINDTLQPYSWYKRFVVEGARQHDLPAEHIAAIQATPSTEDPDQARDRENRAIAC